MTARSLPDVAEMVARAGRLLDRAWAPYSGIRVACVLRTGDGALFEGVNVENSSLGLTICAERNALAAAVTAGAAVGGGAAAAVDLVVFTSNSGHVTVPCGACRQVMAELAPAARIVFARNGRVEREWPSIGALLPEAFDGRWKDPGAGA
jgi:cytidine deaminase